MENFNKKFSQIKESFKKCGCCRAFCFNAAPETPSVKMSSFKLIFRPFGIFTEKLKLLLQVSAVFALLLAVLATGMGFNFLCFGGYQEAFFYCSDSNLQYLVYFLIKMFLLSVFISRWFGLAFLNKTYTWKTLLQPTIKDLAITGVLCLFIALNLIPVISFYMLYMRIPNPDWVVETAYFAVVSLGFLVPFVLMRYYALFAFFLSEEKSPSFATVWARSKGNNLSIILSLFLIIVVMLFIFVNLQRGFSGIETPYATYVGTVSEFFYELMFLMLITLFVNNCYVQKELLFGDAKDGKLAAN